MKYATSIDILKLHSVFLDKNKALVEAIRDRQPREVISGIYKEVQQVYLSITESKRSEQPPVHS